MEGGEQQLKYDEDKRMANEMRKKRIIDRSVEELRIKMMAFVEELLSKDFVPTNPVPSHRETLLKFESFKVETASKKVL